MTEISMTDAETCAYKTSPIKNSMPSNASDPSIFSSTDYRIAASVANSANLAKTYVPLLSKPINLLFMAH